ncbi:hypothetical protein N8I77_013229 [Diaporthe amygdali]|uniref:Heterokaryon incompatibility domain-containing protein n=1 Tax=Phomopsis amygdali TaxID=1214568 RepID=A0AAD9VYP7_PHOAM|nr:hypothetical protein N8I77_013229 [Diaporthe amygdali]
MASSNHDPSHIATTASKKPKLDSCEHFDCSTLTSSTTTQPLQFGDKSGFDDWKLDEQKKQIRILYVLPCSTKEKIQCRLEVKSLCECQCECQGPTYEALSYCWGSPGDPVTITVNERPFKVTRNLNAALKSLIPGSDSTSPRKLWIDAICIDQGVDALSEREWQISMMGDIYKRASSVTAYLGEPFEGLGQAMQFLESSASDPELHFDPETSTNTQVDGVRATSKSLNQALEKFFGFPWWTRMWIVQEYSLAQRLVFQIGNNRIAGDVCAQAVQHIFRHRDIGCCDHRSFPFHGQLDTNGNRLPDIWASFSKLQNLTDTRRDNTISVLDGLGRFSGRDATDPRDKIFALRSLCTSNDKELIEIKCKKCVRCVFLEFTLRWINQKKDLTILSYLGLSTKDASMDTPLDAPSFAVNWGKSPVQGDLASWHRRVAAQARLFNACKNTQAYWGTDSADNFIASGFLFDEIKTVVNGFHGDFYDPDSFGAWLDSTRMLLKDLVVYSNPREALIRAACSDLMFEDDEFERISDDHNFLLNLWRDEVLRLYLVNIRRPPGAESRWPTDYPHIRIFNAETISSIHEPIDTVAVGRSVIVTKEGYIGLAPRDCQSGDFVAIMGGGKMPMALRKSAVMGQGDRSVDMDNGAGASYKVLGDVYVHGIMDGEAFAKRGRGEEELDKLILV